MAQRENQAGAPTFSAGRCESRGRRAHQVCLSAASDEAEQVCDADHPYRPPLAIHHKQAVQPLRGQGGKHLPKSGAQGAAHRRRRPVRQALRGAHTKLCRQGQREGAGAGPEGVGG